MGSHEALRMPAVAVGRYLAQSSTGANEGDNTDVFTELRDELEVVVDRWTVGQLGFTELIAGGVVTAVGAVLYLVIQRVARRLARRSSGVASGALEVTGRLVGVAVMLFSIAIALEILGFTLGPMLVLLLALVVGLLVMRPVITGLSTGLILQARSGLRPGHLIKSNGVQGTVLEINGRTVVLLTPDGREVHIPNTDVLESPIANYTASGHSRSTFELVLENPRDTEAALAAVERSTAGVDAISPDPAPEVVITGLHGHHVVLNVLFWHDPRPAVGRQARHEVARAALAELESAGIRLATPWPALGRPTTQARGRGDDSGGEHP